MSDGHRLAQMMRQAGATPQNEVVDIIVGTVTSVSPLKVKIDKREISETFLIVGALCKETAITAPEAFTIPEHTHSVPAHGTQSGGDPSHSHSVNALTTGQGKSTPTKIILWRGLKVGDSVLMLKVAKGQKYFILQRLEGID